MLRLHHQMHVGMHTMFPFLLSVQGHRITMLMREFLTSEILHCREHLVGWSTRRHGEHDIEGLSRLPALSIGANLAPRMRRPRYRSVIKRPLVDELGRCRLAVEHLTLVGLDIELAMTIDILEMR